MGVDFPLTPAEIKAKYESNADTNAFDDTEQTKLSGIEDDADVTDPTNVAAAGAVMDLKVFTWLDVKEAYLPNTNPVAIVDTPGTGVYAGWTRADFDDTAAEHIIWRVPMPGYDGGTIIVTGFARPAITPGSAKTFYLDIFTIGLANSEAFNSAITVNTGHNINFTFNTTELNTDICISSGNINPANVASGDLMVIELSRDVANDTLVGDGQLIGISIEYTRA